MLINVDHVRIKYDGFAGEKTFLITSFDGEIVKMMIEPRKSPAGENPC